MAERRRQAWGLLGPLSGSLQHKPCWGESSSRGSWSHPCWGWGERGWEAVGARQLVGRGTLPWAAGLHIALGKGFPLWDAGCSVGAMNAGGAVLTHDWQAHQGGHPLVGDFPREGWGWGQFPGL